MSRQLVLRNSLISASLLAALTLGVACSGGVTKKKCDPEVMDCEEVNNDVNAGDNASNNDNNGDNNASNNANNANNASNNASNNGENNASNNGSNNASNNDNNDNNDMDTGSDAEEMDTDDMDTGDMDTGEPDVEPDVPDMRVASAVIIESVGTDIVAVGQSIPLTAVVFDQDGVAIEDAVVEWASSDDSLLAVDDGVVTGLVEGGGDQHTPDGSVFVTASVGELSDDLVVQVVKVDANGIDFVLAELSPEPEGDGPPPEGRAHYDGLYDIRRASPSSCDPYGGQSCTWDVADGRLEVGRKLNLIPALTGKCSAFCRGIFENEFLDAEGDPLAPNEPRAPYVVWESSDPDVASVVDGVLSATSAGVTTVRATIGPQTAEVEIVVYNAFGYDPLDDFSEGAPSEDGHLVLFSSSTRALATGTLDTVRYVDLEDYSNLDFRPSAHGPQGVRLVEDLNQTAERYPGFGCGMVRGRGDVVWLFNGWTAVPFDVSTATQVGGLNKVQFRADGDSDPNGANAVCSGVFFQDGGRDYLIGFDAKAGDTAAFVADVTDLDQGSVVASALIPAELNVELFSPQLHTLNGVNFLLYVQQSPRGSNSTPNRLFVKTLRVEGGVVTLFDPSRITTPIETAPTVNDPQSRAEAPAVAVANFQGTPMIFVGNGDSISVINGETFTPLDYSDVGEFTGIDTRLYGVNVKDFAVSPDGSKLYFLPEIKARNFLPVNWRNFDGGERMSNLNSHSIGVIDLSSGARPMPMDDPSNPDHPVTCYLYDGCAEPEQYQYGYDLNLNALKIWMTEAGVSDNVSLVPPQAMNIRDFSASPGALFIVGNDNADGLGTALGNMSDVAVINLATGRMPVFRGWRSDPQRLQGLSDPFGFRVGEGDVLLDGARTKHAGVLFVPGDPPAERAGDGRLFEDAIALPDNDNYLNAPTPNTEEGRLLVLSSSHPEAANGTYDVVRELDLSTAGWPETDFDAGLDGAQGVELTYTVSDTTVKWRGGCGIVRPDPSITALEGIIFLLNGDSAVAFDTVAMTQGMGGHQVTFDPNPQTASTRVCKGAVAEVGGRIFFYGVDIDARPDAPIHFAEITGLADADVDAQPVVDGFLTPNPDASESYDIRYSDVLVHDGELFVLEKNDPWQSYRNTAHRATIGADGGLTFDDVATRERDLTAAWTADDSGDPGFIVARHAGVPHLFIGNQGSVTVYDLGGASPTRVNYNTDGDGVQDDLNTAWFGRGVQSFGISADGARLYALPYQKSAAPPSAMFTIATLSGGTRTERADRFRMAVIDLTGGDAPALDADANGGNGVDLNYYWLKAALVEDGPTPLPPTFPFFRGAFAASESMLFLFGRDADDGIGTALSNMSDMATYDVASGAGHIWRGYEYEGIFNASGLWGFRLGVDPVSGLEDENNGARRIKNAGAIYLP